MSHNVYILHNETEAYVMVRKQYFTLEWLTDKAFSNDEVFEFKNGVLSLFLRENVNKLTMVRFTPDVELKTFADVLSYRQKMINRVAADGYIILDEKSNEVFDKPANENFAEVTKRIDISAAIKKFGSEILIRGRKTLTVGEFIANYG